MWKTIQWEENLYKKTRWNGRKTYTKKVEKDRNTKRGEKSRREEL